jgi:hypothetical protein
MLVSDVRAQLPEDARRTAQTSASVAASAKKARPSGFTREAAAPQGQGQGPVNPRLLPDISAVGDLIGDLSPDGSTQEDGTRFGVREIEIALQAAVDPSFRGDVFLGFSDEEGVHIEQAYLTATSLPWALEVRLGRYLMPVTKQNTTHRHDLHTIEHSYATQRFLGAEGAKGTGVWVSRVISPFKFYQEVILTVTDRLGEAPEDLVVEDSTNEDLSGLAYSARLRNYWDLSQSTNLEVSGSVLTGKLEQPVVGAADGINAVTARQSLYGVDVTFRWRPLQQGLYKSLIVQAEYMRQMNDDPGALPPPEVPTVPVVYAGLTQSLNGGYLFGRYQISRRGYVGGRFDIVDDPLFGGDRSKAASGYLIYYPSEFSKLVAGYERFMPGSGSATNRILLQAAFALGPHRPHPF